jgi:hypothetical protein
MVVSMAFNEVASSSMDMGPSQGSMAEDCPMMAKTNSEKSAAYGEGKAKSTHQACQLCMSLAATQVPVIKFIPLLSQPQAVLHVDRFASAELLRFTKPPIY